MNMSLAVILSKKKQNETMKNKPIFNFDAFWKKSKQINDLPFFEN